MRIFDFLFFKTHALLYPLMHPINRPYSDYGVSIILGLSLSLNWISFLALLERKFKLGMAFENWLTFALFWIPPWLITVIIYSINPRGKFVIRNFKEQVSIRWMTSILVVFYYVLTVYFFFELRENSPWRA